MLSGGMMYSLSLFGFITGGLVVGLREGEGYLTVISYLQLEVVLLSS